MHYKDGTEAKLGDIIKLPDGEVGVLVGGSPGATACNITALRSKVMQTGPGVNVNNGPAHVDYWDGQPTLTYALLHYGDASACELVHRPA